MRKLFAVFVALALAFCASAQSSIKLQAPELVALDEQFNVTFIISGEDSPSGFEWNCGDDFQLVWGPQKGTSTSVTISNGQRTKTSQTTYTYVLLPKKTGRFQLQGATATVKKDKISSGPRTIEVVASDSRQGTGGRQQSAEPERQERAQSGTVSNEDIYMRLSLSKSSVVVGEGITATLKLYQRVNIAGFEDVRFPSFNGFWSQETQAPSNIEFHRENVGGTIYNAAVIRSWTLIPQQAGEIKIDPAELVCLVNVRAPRSSMGSIFDSFFQDDYQTIRKRVSSGAATVKVKPVPAGAPASFGGGVGTFRMEAVLTRDSLRTHDASSLKITVSGKGNVALLEAPKVNFPPDFEAYDVKTSETSGSKTFEYPFIPRSHGDFVLGPVEYSYYDVSAGKYVTLRSQVMNINVAKGNESSSSESTGQLLSVPGKKDVRDLGSDIRFIQTKMPVLRDKGAFFVGSGLFWTLTVLLLALCAAAFFLFRRFAARRADVVGSKRRSATKMARKKLALAGDYLSKNLYSAFYEELHKALLGYVSDKLAMDAGEMSRENIAERLKDKGVSEGVVSEFTSLIEACEFARYSPDAGHDAMNAHYENAVAVVSAIDESMKRSRKSVSGAAALVLLLMLAPMSSFAEDTETLWNEGVQAYSESRWGDAVQSWQSILASGVESPALYCNIADAFFKDGDIAHAILNYERALKIDPSHKDARYNLEYARSLTQDKIEAVPEFFVEVWGRKACWLLPSDVWAVLFVILLAGAAAMLLVYLLSHRTAARKVGFFSSLAILLAAIVCLDFAFWQRTDYRNDSAAIVMKAVCAAKSSPGASSSVDLFVLHEGTKVKIEDEVGEWLEVELADGRQGWISASDVDRI